MPELPDITLYLEQLAPRILGQPLLRLVFRSPFILRSVDASPFGLRGKASDRTAAAGQADCVAV